MALPTFTMQQLMEAGVHFGHHTRRWAPHTSLESTDDTVCLWCKR